MKPIETIKQIPFRKYLIRTFITLLVLLIAWVLVAVFYNYSDGFRAGTVIKLSEKGYLFKTYEGQLYTGAIPTVPGSGKDVFGGGLWNFSVLRSNHDVIKALEDASAKGLRVKLHYKEKLYQYNWRGETKYFVYRVEEIK